MKILISHYIRKIADMIVEDTTPTDEELEERRRNVRPINEDEATVPVRVPKPQVVDEKVRYAPLPEIKRPRRQPSHKNKWNEDTKTGLMKEYMQQYRADGKNLETNSPKSKYVKKPKI